MCKIREKKKTVKKLLKEMRAKLNVQKTRKLKKRREKEAEIPRVKLENKKQKKIIIKKKKSKGKKKNNIGELDMETKKNEIEARGDCKETGKEKEQNQNCLKKSENK